MSHAMALLCTLVECEQECDRRVHRVRVRVRIRVRVRVRVRDRVRVRVRPPSWTHLEAIRCCARMRRSLARRLGLG
jgi:hypothetical protein